METIKNISLAILMLVLTIYVGIKAALFAFSSPIDFTILQALALAFTFVSCVTLITIGVYIAGVALKESDSVTDSESSRLLVAAILSNDGYLNIQNSLYQKVANMDGEYVFDVQDKNGVTTLKLKEKMHGG